MKIAVMQPYIFPYIGYFQLINSVDKFIFLDDVNFIKRGWINRNRILLNDQSFLFTIPLNNISQYKIIRQTEIAYDTNWQSKLLKTIEQAYKKAPMYAPVIEMISSVIGEKHTYVSEMAFSGIKTICEYLSVDTKFVDSSAKYQNSDLKGEDRIIDICLKENASVYVNAAGGRELYNRQNFTQKGIDLRFINTVPFAYHQFGKEFHPNLSIIDILMFNQKDEVRRVLDNYTLS